MTSTMTRDVERLIERARERMAEFAAWRALPLEQRTQDRYPEFCGAFRELLSMLVTELDPRPVTSSVHDWDAEAAEREQYADVMAADLAEQRRYDR